MRVGNDNCINKNFKYKYYFQIIVGIETGSFIWPKEKNIF